MYRAVHETFWTDPDLKAVGHEARNLFAFLITGPSAHMSGIYRLTFATMADDYGVTVNEAKKLVDALIDAKFVSYDFDRSIIWVHNMYRHQPKGPNHKRSVEQQLTKLHGSHLAASFCEYYSEHNICYETVPKRLPNGCQTVSEPERAKGEGEGEGKGTEPSPLTPPPKRGTEKRIALKDPTKLQEELSAINVSDFIRRYEPEGLDVSKCFDSFTEYVIRGSPRKPFPNPSNWRDFSRAFHDSCKSAIDRGRFRLNPETTDDAWKV